MTIWENWCFGQFYHSRIEFLQNCPVFLSVSFSRERKSERNERKYKTQNLILRRCRHSVRHGQGQPALLPQVRLLQPARLVRRGRPHPQLQKGKVVEGLGIL